MGYVYGAYGICMTYIGHLWDINAYGDTYGILNGDAHVAHVWHNEVQWNGWTWHCLTLFLTINNVHSIEDLIAIDFGVVPLSHILLANK